MWASAASGGCVGLPGAGYVDNPRSRACMPAPAEPAGTPERRQGLTCAWRLPSRCARRTSTCRTVGTVCCSKGGHRWRQQHGGSWQRRQRQLLPTRAWGGCKAPFLEITHRRPGTKSSRGASCASVTVIVAGWGLLGRARRASGLPLLPATDARTKQVRGRTP